MSEGASEKTAKKTAKSPRNGAAIPLGAHPQNTGGKKGRSGRKPNWYKEFCESVLADPKHKAAVRAVLTDEGHPAFAAMTRVLSDRAFGKATERVEHSGPDGDPMQVQVWKFGDDVIRF